MTTSSVLIAWDSKDSNMTGLKGKIKKIHFKQLKKFQSTYNVNVTACRTKNVKF